jgi:hypothetical protein
MQRAILKLGSPAKTEDILRELGLRKRQRKTGARRLAEALGRGEIQKIGKGLYTLPQNDGADHAGHGSDHGTPCPISVPSDVPSADAVILA